ncbi:MAG: dTDP-glucose 4,6-dehydratase [Rhodospirillaceae bacterium]|nr:dTDP-glucose 4,6-dehydratase [Rhodospirillaceae bacterium]
MKVLITGGAGFIGSALVRVVLAQGCKVINLDKFTYSGRQENLTDASLDKNYTLVKGDVCDRSLVKEIFAHENPNVVFHLAAESHVDRSIDDSAEFVRTNVVGTHNLVQSAVDYFESLSAPDQRLFRFVHVSTDEVFGSLQEGEYFSEEMPYRPNSPYAATKASSDHIVRAANKTFGLPTLVCHPANNFGPRQHPEKLTPLCLLNALDSQPIPVYGDGSQIRDWIYVEDTVAAFWAIFKKGVPGDSYCISAESSRHNIDVINMICTVLDKITPHSSGPYSRLISHVADRAGHDTCYQSSAEKLRSTIGWSPTVPFEEGLERTVKWYLENKTWWQSLRDARKRQGIRKAR